MALQSDKRRLTNRPWPLESIGNSLGDAYVNIGDSLGGAYVNIGNGMGGAYVKNSSDLNIPFWGQSGPFPPLLSPKTRDLVPRTPKYIFFHQKCSRFSLGFQNKNPNSSRFDRRFSKIITYLESPIRKLQETSIILGNRGTWGYPKISWV